MLLISHDLDGLDHVDEIVAADGGRVAERGTHSELAAAGGLYLRMLDAGRPMPVAGAAALGPA